MKLNETNRSFFATIIKNNVVLSCLITLVFFAIVMAIFPIRFIVNDDSLLMRMFAGYQTGTPIPETAVTYVTFGLIVSTLYRLLPMIPWYTVFLVAVMYISTAVIVYVFLSESRKNGVSPILSIATIIAFLCLFLIRPIVGLHFTIVSGFAGSAAIVLFCFFKPDGVRHNVKNIIAIALLFFLCISIRIEVGHLVLALLACVMLYKLVYYIKQYKTHLITAAAIVFVFLSAMLLDAVYKNNDAWREFQPHYIEYVVFADYPRLPYGYSPEVYHAAGWTSVEYNLAHNWCFIFPEFNAEALSYINNAAQYFFGDTFSLTLYGRAQIVRILDEAILSSNYNIAAYIALMCIWGASILVALLKGKKIYDDSLSFVFEKISWLRFLKNHRLFLSLGIMFLFHAVCTYQIFMMRFTDRAFNMVLIVFAALSIINLASMIGTEKIAQLMEPTRKSAIYRLKFARAMCLSLAVVLVGISVYTITLLDIQGMREAKHYYESKRTDMDNYAISNPDSIFVYSTNAAGVGNPFAVFGEQKPVNAFIWGGWSYLSPAWSQQLYAVGRESLLLEDFWDENVYLVAGTEHEIEFLQSYFRRTHPGSYFTLVDELPSGINVFRLSR